MISNQPSERAYPCIIDLRAFAEQSGGEDSADAGSDFLASRRHVDLPEGPTALGVIELGASAGRVDAMPWHEFILVHEGELRIGGSAEIMLRKGESAVLPKNSTFTWTAEQRAVLFFLRQESDAPESRQPLKIDPSLPRVASPPLADGLVIGAMPKAFHHLDFESEDKLFAAASWNSNGYARHAFEYQFFELMYLLEGSVALTDRAGTEHVFSKDDIVVVRKGALVSWASTVQVSKIAAISRA